MNFRLGSNGLEILGKHCFKLMPNLIHQTARTWTQSDPAIPSPVAKQLAAFPIFQDLTDADRSFLAAVGTVRALDKGAVIPLSLGEDAAMMVVLAGAMRIGSKRPQDDDRILDAGEVGGLSALVGSNGRWRSQCLQPALTTARDNSEVLLIPLRALRARCASAPALAARIYRMCARALADRSEVARKMPSDLGAMWAAIHDFQMALHNAERGALENSGEVPEELSITVRKGFRRVVMHLHASLGPKSGRSSAERDSLGHEVQRAVLPYLLLTDTSERLYSKPRGYAGDAVSIDGIYANQPSGVGRLGPLLDCCFLDEPAAQAVRNRRGLLREEIEAVLRRHPDRQVQITTMACGPAREVFDVFDNLDDIHRLQVHLIDLDQKALDQVQAEAVELGIHSQLHFHHADLIKLSLGRQRLDIPPQDLVYSIGLIDYFIDKLVIKLMNYGHHLLRPNGEMILGNFHPGNPNKELMDHVLDWRLHHRSEDHMDRLYRESHFARSCTRFRFEETGVNLFATCRREQD